jgi:LysM repeat protein
MNPETSSKPTKLCPTCGTRLSEDAVRCLVCGADLSGVEKAEKTEKSVQGSRMPVITLSLPLVLGLMIIFLATGAGMVYYTMRQTGQVVEPPTVTPTVTITVTPSITATQTPPAPTNTPEPTSTPQSYTVRAGDSCSTIAFTFGVSIPSIVLINDLPATCDIFEGMQLLIPQPTPTATAPPTATLNPAEATRAACGEFEYTVQDVDTLSSISLNYNIPIVAIKEYNGLVNDVVRSGQILKLPLCERNATPGPSPTPTPPPPYPAPNLLLPADGSPFTTADGGVSLQWAAVSTLRSDEAYQVIVVDITEGQDRRLLEYVNDTKYIVPLTFLPTDGRPHILRWWVLTAISSGPAAAPRPLRRLQHHREKRRPYPAPAVPAGDRRRRRFFCPGAAALHWNAQRPTPPVPHGL